MKGFVWRWMVALCVFTEIVAAQNKVASGNERNVAPNRPCSIATTDGVNCSRVFDVDRNTCVETRFDLCNNTNSSHISVILKHSYIIHKMVVYPPNDNRKDRMNNVQVIFDGEVVDTLQEPTGDSVTVNIDKRGRRGTKNVTLYREVTEKDHCSGGAYPSITICEVQIYTCTAGKWGQSCDQQCGVDCPECKDSASDCLECKEGFWGTNLCPNNCGEGCESGNCSIANGTCQCRKTQGQHWEPPKCESCIEKYWGDKCETSCPQNCQGPCNKTNGQCEGCIEKYWGDKCETSCPQNCQGPCNKTDGKCEGCKEKYWGDKCEKSCPQNCRSCKKTDGQCEVTLPPTAASPPSEKKFPMWAAALIALGILCLIALLLFLVWRKRRQAQDPAQAPEGGPNENPEGEAEGEGEMSSQAEQSAEVAEESQQASEGGEAAPAE